MRGNDDCLGSHTQQAPVPMNAPITHLPFADWVTFIFDHPADGPEWYWADDAPSWNGPSSLTCDYVTRLFEDPIPALEGYSDAELNRGLN
jgi:hypothetical protein